MHKSFRHPSLLLLAGAFALAACGDDVSPSPDAGVNECPAPTGAGTTHELFVSANETWTLEGSPHLLPDGLNIEAAAVITVEACAVVRVGAGRDINVSGKLVTQGEDGKPVRFERLESGSAWGSIVAIRVDAPLSFSYTQLVGGGALPPNGIQEQYGLIRLEATRDAALSRMLHANALSIEGSDTNGIHLWYNAAFTEDSSQVSVSGAAGHPIVSDGWNASSIPTGRYRDNGVDQILVRTSEYIGIDGIDLEARWKKLDVPYRVGAENDGSPAQLRVGGLTGSSRSKLILDPGVELRFRPLAGLVAIGPNGILSAEGSVDQPVVFTSGAPVQMAGDWLGLHFDDDVSLETSIRFAKILFAGNSNTGQRSFSCGTPKAPAMDQAQTMGAVYLTLDEGAPSTFIFSTEIRASASNGIDRGWTGEGTDLTVSNTFAEIAFCKQTDQRPLVGTCAEPPMCPSAGE